MQSVHRIDRCGADQPADPLVRRISRHPMSLHQIRCQRRGIVRAVYHGMHGRSLVEAIRQQQHHVGLGVGEHLLVEHHQLDPGESVEQELAHRRRVVDAQQFRRQDQGHSPARPQKQRRMHRERRPTGGECRQRHPGPQRGPAGLSPRRPAEILVADIAAGCR